jgi:indoleamine 2,3-dioxygenase
MAEILARLRDYQVSTAFGFLPASAPLESLPNAYYVPWESAAAALPQSIRDGTLRQRVATIPLLTTEFLFTEEEWRRSYVILGFLCNGFIFSEVPPSEVRFLD